MVKMSWRSVLVVALAAPLAAAAMATPASADVPFEVVPGAQSFVQSGPGANVAGGHPDVSIDFRLATDPTIGVGRTPQAPRTATVELPPGLVGDPKAADVCPLDDVIAGEKGESAGRCPRRAAVGTVALDATYVNGNLVPLQRRRLYRVAAGPNEVAAFATSIITTPVRIAVTVSPSGGYRVRATADSLTQAAFVRGFTVTLWGVPADRQGLGTECEGYVFGGTVFCMDFLPADDPAGNPNVRFGGPLAGAPRQPFLTNPSVCGSELIAGLRVVPYGTIFSPIATTMCAGTISGCESQPFDASVDVVPSTKAAGQPSSYAVGITVPQSTDADGVATAHVKDVQVTLPEGVAISPPSADGLDACSDAQLDLNGDSDAKCPAASRIGTMTVESPVLDEPLTGSAYLGTQLSKDPASGEMYRLFLVVKGPGVLVKLKGAVKANPQTGQLTATFNDNPQLPFSKFTLLLDGGDRAPLATPDGCGTYTTRAALSSWGGQSVAPSSVFATDQNCGQARAFAPGLVAGTTNAVAAQHTSFVLRITHDGGAPISTVKTVLPKGLLADLKHTPRCAEPQAAVGACPASTQIGSTTVGAGEGASPLYLPMAGKSPTAVYLAGPYKGAPLSLSIVVPAQAGPFDLGVVVVRAALSVDPNTAQATVVSDPLPTIVGGVPLHLRDINVNITKPGFMFNPTNCDTTALSAAITSSYGQASANTSRFQTIGCSDLKLQPRLEIRLSGRGQTTDDKHPALSARLTQAPGESNIDKVKVTLPLSLALDPDNANGLCEPVDAAADKCPASTIVGAVKAQSPILDGQLSGPVYFVRGERIDAKSGRTIKTLPKLYVPMTASDYPALQINLNANSEVIDDHLVTTFDNVPDAPISSFDLSIAGGEHGILVVSRADLCKDTQIADQQVNGQSGKLYQSQITMSTPCRLAVVQSSHSSKALKVMIGGIAAGTLKVSGKGLRSTSRTIKRATTATLQVPLSKATRAALAEHRNIKVAVTVRFTPTGKKAAKMVKHLIIHGAVKKK